MTPLEDRVVPAAPLVDVANIADAVEGVSNGYFRFERYGFNLSQPLTIYYTISGSAASGTDYAPLTGSVTIEAHEYEADIEIDVINSPYDDATIESDETVTLTLTEDSGYTIGLSEATVTISDNDAPAVSVEMIEDAGEDGSHGIFRFTRMGDTSGTLTVNYSLGGTAASGTDFTALSGSVVFAAGEATADVEVEALHDAVYDPDETVTIAVTSGTGYTIGNPDDAELIIYDDAALIFDGGAVWYDIDWSAWDVEEEDPQELPLTNFSLVFNGQTFTEANATITASVADLEYVDDNNFEVTDVEFTVTFASPVNGIKKLVADGGQVTVYDVADQQVGDATELQQKAAPSLVIDFSKMEFPQEITWKVTGQIDDGELKSIGDDTLLVPMDGTPGQIRDLMEGVLRGLGMNVEPRGDTRLMVSAPAGKKLVNIKITANVTTLPKGPTGASNQGNGPFQPVLIYERTGDTQR